MEGVSRGDLISSASSSYLVEEIIGEGNYGQVARCVKTATNEKVAVKIMISDRFMIASAKQEIAILARLQVLDPDECGIVRWMGVFTHGPRICLEFELLDRSLRDLTQQTERHILPLIQIRIILEQLARALHYLGTIGIIHADLKPENIMLTEQDTRVKLIDFGISYHVSKAKIGLEIQTMFYRSPEIILGLPFTGMVDMWSLGCVAAELFIGMPIFPGYMEYDLLRYILETNGNLPVAMLDHGIKTHLFFNKGSTWRLKSAQEYEERESLKPPWPRRFVISSLEEMVELGTGLDGPIPPSFTDLMKRMLQLDANQRITPCAMLEHPFMSLRREFQTNTSSPVSSVDAPNTSTPVSNVGPPDSSNPVSSVNHPKSYCTEDSVDLEDIVYATDSGKGSLSEGEIRDIYNLSWHSEMFRFTPTPTSLCDLIEAAEELRIEESVTAEKHSSPVSSVDPPGSSTPVSSADQPKSYCTDDSVDLEDIVYTSNSGKGSFSEGEIRDIYNLSWDSEMFRSICTPTTSCVVAMETVAGQPAVADIPIEVTQKNMKKRFFKSMLKTFICCCVYCCCPAPDDED